MPDRTRVLDPPPGQDAMNLLSVMQDGLEQGRDPVTGRLAATQQLRIALGAATTGQVVAAVSGQLRRMNLDWAKGPKVPRLTIQARVLLQLLAELGDFPGGPDPDPLVAATGDDDAG